MEHRLLALMGVVVAIAVVALASVACQGPKAAPSLKTTWGDSDLQGIWTDDYQTPLQRPAKYAGREFLTDAEIAELDKARASILRQDDRGRKGTEGDVAGAYNAFFVSVRHTGRRTSLVVDPPDGRVPALTPEAQKRFDIKREFS